MKKVINNSWFLIACLGLLLGYIFYDIYKKVKIINYDCHTVDYPVKYVKADTVPPIVIHDTVYIEVYDDLALEVAFSTGYNYALQYSIDIHKNGKSSVSHDKALYNFLRKIKKLHANQ